MASNETGYVWDERFGWHDTGTHAIATQSALYPTRGVYVQQWHHIESPESKTRIHSLLSVSGTLEQVVQIKSRAATRTEVERFHTKEYIDRLKHASDNGGADMGEEALVGRGSYDIALYAAGSCVEVVAKVMKGELQNGYCLVRPPGHHAERDRGMGYCLINNIAVAANAAISDHGARRVAIVDWDVHHGNGTQQAFYDRNDVLFLSIHQDNLYPTNSGAYTDVGEGLGTDYNINIPLPPGTGHGGYLAVMDRVVLPAIRAFRPDIILISCGFDAGALDPLGTMMLSGSCFGDMTQKLVNLAKEICHGRVVVCHEGGYNPCQTPFCGLRVVEALLGVAESSVVDPYDAEIRGYGYHDLQAHQNQVIERAESHVEILRAKCEQINGIGRGEEYRGADWKGLRETCIREEGVK